MSDHPPPVADYLARFQKHFQNILDYIASGCKQRNLYLSSMTQLCNPYMSHIVENYGTSLQQRQSKFLYQRWKRMNVSVVGSWNFTRRFETIFLDSNNEIPKDHKKRCGKGNRAKRRLLIMGYHGRELDAYAWKIHTLQREREDENLPFDPIDLYSYKIKGKTI